jgi:hypothetical protein
LSTNFFTRAPFVHGEWKNTVNRGSQVRCFTPSNRLEYGTHTRGYNGNKSTYNNYKCSFGGFKDSFSDLTNFSNNLKNPTGGLKNAVNGFERALPPCENGSFGGAEIPGQDP